jgi:hypothetical protein
MRTKKRFNDAGGFMAVSETVNAAMQPHPGQNPGREVKLFFAFYEITDKITGHYSFFF